MRADINLPPHIIIPIDDANVCTFYEFSKFNLKFFLNHNIYDPSFHRNHLFSALAFEVFLHFIGQYGSLRTADSKERLRFMFLNSGLAIDGNRITKIHLLPYKPG